MLPASILPLAEATAAVRRRMHRHPIRDFEGIVLGSQAVRITRDKERLHAPLVVIWKIVRRNRVVDRRAARTWEGTDESGWRKPPMPSKLSDLPEQSKRWTKSYNAGPRPMTDYYPVIAGMVADLKQNTGKGRIEIYQRARATLVGELHGLKPPLTESEITRERLSLEKAIRKVEAEAVRRKVVAPPRPAVLKAGVIEDMVYTVFQDGSIEAKLPEGTLTFSSLDELNGYIVEKDRRAAAPSAAGETAVR